MQNTVFKIDKIDFLNIISFKLVNFVIVVAIFFYVRNNFSNQDFIDFGYFWNISLMLAGIFFGGLSATITRILNVQGGIKSLVESNILKLFIIFNIFIALSIILIAFTLSDFQKIYFFLLFTFGLFFQIQTLLITVMRVKKYSVKMNLSAIISLILVLSCFYFLTNVEDSTEKLFFNLVISYLLSVVCIIFFLKSTLINLYDSNEKTLDFKEYKDSYITYTAINIFTYVYLTIDFYLLREMLPEEQMILAGSTKIYFDRFIIPFLTIISGVFSLNVYRTKSNSIVGNEDIKINFEVNKKYLALIPLIIFITCFVYFYVYSTNQSINFLQVLILSFCYIIFNINGVLLDGVAIKQKPLILTCIVIFFLLVSYITYFILIKAFEFNGWIIGMTFLNILGFILFYIFTRSSRLTASQ